MECLPRDATTAACGLQGAGDLILAQVNIHDHREAQSDSARTSGNDNGIDGAEGIDESGDSVLGVFQQAGQIAGLHITEDQSSADGNGDHMDDGGHIMAQGDDAEFQTHLDTLGHLLDAVADQEGHDALGLVILDNLNNIFGIVRLAQHNGHAGDIAGNQGHAQGANDGIGHEADAGFICIGLGRFRPLQAFDNLGAYSGGASNIITNYLMVFF